MIRISVYNKEIVVPAKCGSRFLDTIWEDKIDLSIGQLLESDFQIKKIIVRHPYEHLLSGLHTDILHIWNKEWENVNEIDVITNYHQINNGSHYQLDLYQTLYEYWVKHNKEAEIIKLENLTGILKDVDVLYNYDENDYNWKPIFEVWKTKEEIMEYVKKTYPETYNFLIKHIKEEINSYNKMINNE